MSEIIIVGGGVIGTATAHALLERGVKDITILERDSVGSGGTGRSAGIVRCHYGVSSVAALALAGLDFFENATEIVGSDCGFEQVGYLVGVGAENVEPLRASLANQQRLGITTQEVTAADIQEMWPTANLEDLAAFCFEPRGGYGDGYATAQAFASLVRSRGVTIRQGSPVSEVLTTGGAATGVRLADGETIGAERVIVAAGSWSVPLLRPLGIELPITPVLFEQVLIDPGMDIGAPPVFSDLVSHQYVSPRKGELLFGSSAAEAEAFPVVDPDTFPQRARNSTIELIAENALHRFPGIERPRISTSSNGVVDSTTDNNPILSGTDFPGLFVAAGMSGHGFKLSPAIGQFMADLTLGREISIPNVVADDFRLTRFAEGDLLVSPYVYSGSSGIR